MMGESGQVSHKGEAYICNISLDESLIVTDVAVAIAEKYAHFSPPFSYPTLMMISVNEITITPVLMLYSLTDFILRNGWSKRGS